MPSYLSLRICWLPRRIFLRSMSDANSSEYRSASRFSLKIARFLFLKDRMNTKSTITTIVPLSTHAHYTKRETDDNIQDLARNFLLSLEPGAGNILFSSKVILDFEDQRRILREELTQVEKIVSTTTDSITIRPSQLAIVFLETGLPFIGFGFVDNFVMLVAGETIETFFGAAFCLSTMAAAGLGNAVSDVMGIGLADRIERTCGKFLALFGLQSPELSAAQWSLRSVQNTQLLSKAICIFLGCVLGMCPLLFRDTSPNKKDD